MTRGTIIFCGPMNREAELLCTRLEREAFGIVPCTTESALVKWLAANHPQAVLVSGQCHRKTIEAIEQRCHKRKSTHYVPIMLVTDSDISGPSAPLAGVGEIFRLHALPLARVIDRIRLAIQLSQMAQQLKL